MKRSLIALAILLTATAAYGQNSQTSCYAIGAQWHCNTTTQNQQMQTPMMRIPPPVQMDGFQKAFEAGMEKRRQRDAQQKLLELQFQQQAQQQAAVDSAAQALEEHKANSLKVAQMAAAGDCTGAEAYALSVGNLVLAKQVKDYCGTDQK